MPRPSARPGQPLPALPPSPDARSAPLLRRPEPWLLLACSMLSLCKLALLEASSRELLECRWCLSGPGVPHELEFNLTVAALYLASSLPPWRPLRQAMRASVVALLLIAVTDLVVTRLFLVRFSIDELTKFAGETQAIDTFVRPMLAGPGWTLMLALAVMGLLAAIVALVVCEPRMRHAGRWALGSAAAGALVAQGLAQATPQEYHAPYLRNAVEAFFSAPSRQRPYSAGFRQSLAAKPGTQTRCGPALDRRPDLILLVVESLSAYQSKLFSGLEDWTPELDALAEQGLRLPNFLANGVTTEEGLISLLTGEPPMARGDSPTVFESFMHPVDSVPRMLAGQGYRSVFLTTGDRGFLGKGRWLSAIGFDTVEGHESPFYRGMPRFHFQAAADEALYARALKQLEQLDALDHGAGERPVFLMLETVSSHHPYIEPHTGERSQEAVFRYTDRQIGEFARDLKARGFFEHGVLMIVGDHRAMMPMSHRELARFGDSAYARVPFVVIGHDAPPQEIGQRFSQNDLLPSLRHWIGSGVQCVAANQGVFLPEAERSPRCSYTLRTYALDEVHLQCLGAVPVVHLDGDRTRFVGATAGSAGQLDEVNRLRLGLGF
jgi:hypothetical protein